MSSKPTELLPVAAPTATSLVHFALDAGGGVYHSRQATIGALLGLLVDAAPGALDTLNELAAALGDDPNFAATIAAQIAAINASLGLLVPAVVADAAYTMQPGDTYAAKRLTNAALVTVTAALDATSAVPIGARCRFIVEGAAGAVLAAEGGVTLVNRDNPVNAAQGSVFELHKIAANKFAVLGDLQ